MCISKGKAGTHIAARALLVVLFAASALATASTASAQAAPPPSERFVLGPLQWTPTLQLREAGYDSNVFNTQANALADYGGTFVPSANSTLTLGIAQATNFTSLEYVYFQKYTNQRSVNGHLSTKIVLPFSRIQPAFTASWARVHERPTDEIDLRAARTDHGFGGGLTTKLSTRLDLVGTIDRQYTIYDPGQIFLGSDLATELNRTSTNITTGIRYTVTPFTTVLIDAGVGRDEFVFGSERNTNNERVNVGLQFAPDAVFSGHATVGYHDMQPEHSSVLPDAAAPFSGLTSSVDMSYTLLGRTRISPRYLRDTTYSATVDQPYYLATTVGLDILQTLAGPFSLTVRGSRERDDYPATPLAAPRHDRYDIYGGGLSIRISTTGTILLNYEDARRDSDAGSLFDYSRRRIYTTITYGF